MTERDEKYNGFPRLVAETDQLQPAPGPLKGGGGDGTSNEMEARVKALEDRFTRVETKLDAIATDIAYMKGKMEGLPTAIVFGELKGRVDSLPTTAKIAAVVGMVVGPIGLIVTILLRWSDIVASIKP